jgi:hypothetical protein
MRSQQKTKSPRKKTAQRKNPTDRTPAATPVLQVL